MSDLFGDGVRRDAIVSHDGRYRFRLERVWDDLLPTLAAVMLNPSYANASRDDHTVTGLMVRCRAAGFGRLVVVNCSPYRSRDPFALRHLAREEILGPVLGSVNDHHIRVAAGEADRVLCAWGGQAINLDLHERTLAILEERARGDLYVLKVNRDGTPHHPLRLGYGVEMTPWNSLRRGLPAGVQRGF
jgi:hypothetical protein